MYARYTYRPGLSRAVESPLSPGALTLDRLPEAFLSAGPGECRPIFSLTGLLVREHRSGRHRSAGPPVPQRISLSVASGHGPEVGGRSRRLIGKALVRRVHPFPAGGTQNGQAGSRQSRPCRRTRQSERQELPSARISAFRIRIRRGTERGTPTRRSAKRSSCIYRRGSGGFRIGAGQEREHETGHSTRSPSRHGDWPRPSAE